MLAALGQNFGGVITPRLLLADRTANLMVMEDVAGMTDLHSIMKSNNANAQVPVPAAAAIGKTLGAWLRRFHEWGSAPEQSILVEKVAQNRSMRNLKLKITYDIFIGVIEDFPDIMGDLRSILDEIRQMAVGEFAKEPGHDSKAGWGLIHGDFWTGKYVSNHPGSGRQRLTTSILFNAGTSDMAVIDWEFAQFGCWAYDVGQMIGDLYERHHYDNLEHTMSMTKQFAQGYGCVSDDMAFRVAIHAGVQVLGWYRRRAPGAPLPGSQSLIEDMVRLGTDLVVKGWTRDRAWFEDGPLAPLFT